MRCEQLGKIAEAIHPMASEFSVAFREELVMKYAQELQVSMDFGHKKVGKFAALHSEIIAYKQGGMKASTNNSNDKIGAIKALRTYAENHGYGKLGLKYAKDYVEWVMEYPGSYEPAF